MTKKLTPEEKAMNKFKKDWAPENLSPSAFKQLVEQLGIKNSDIDVKPAIDASQLAADFKDSGKKEEQRAETLVDSQKKLVDKLESLNKTLAKLLPTVGGGDNKQKPQSALDYRPIGQQFKEKILGRPQEGGAFETNSLRWKLGSVRGLALSSGLVKPGGMIDNATAVREERLMKQAGVTRSKEDEEKETQDDKLNVSQEEENTLKAMSSGADATHELIAITKVENERKTKADAELLAAIQNMQSAGGGGVLGSAIEAAGDIASAKSLAKGGKGASKLGTLAKFAAKNSKALKIGGGVLTGGIAAYQGYSDYKEADAAEKAGTITKDEANVKKTGAVTGAAGGLGGALGGAALGTMILPGVGTLIGGAIGGLAGSKVGKGIGEWGAKTWQGITGGDKPGVKTAYTKNIEAEMKAQEYQKTHPGLSPQEALEAVKRQEAGIVEPNQSFAPVTPTTANTVIQASADNSIAKMPSNAAPSNSIINAPTNISKQTQNTTMKVNIKDQDNTLRSYYRSRFAI